MTTAYPLAGHRAVFAFLDVEVEHRFEDERRFHFSVRGGPHDGLTGVTEQQVKPLRDGLFLTSWTEDDGTHVVHVEDFARWTYDSIVVTPAGQLFRFEGTIRAID